MSATDPATDPATDDEDRPLVRITFPAGDGPLAAVALLTLDRPDALNALSFALVEELGGLLAVLDEDPGCRAIVITGAGDRAFAAGADIRELAGPEIALIGNLPPRDVLAAKSPDEVREETKNMVHEFGDKNRVIWSCGGGMPPNVTTENILSFKGTIDSEV